MVQDAPDDAEDTTSALNEDEATAVVEESGNVDSEGSAAGEGTAASAEEPVDASGPPVKKQYTVDEMMALQSKFMNAPDDFAKSSLDCIGSASAVYPSQQRDGDDRRRSSAADRGRRGSYQQHPRDASAGHGQRQGRQYESARSHSKPREPSREMSRAQFGNLRGTIKGDRDRGSRRGSQYDGPIRAVEPYVEPLAVTDSRYVVKKAVEGEELVLRQVQSILNKLTPEKFSKLVQQLVDLITDNVEHLEMVIGLVFDKAVGEYAFANMYADLCSHLSARFAKMEGETAKFRNIILARCKYEFDNRAKIEDFQDMESEEERSPAITKARRRSRGLVSFIGHLYNRDLLHYSIMRICLATLCPNAENAVEWDIEDMCILWGVFGKKFAARQPRIVDICFDIIQSIIADRKMPSRIIFMLQDLVDLRANRWEPRREVVVASTIAEVHKKAAADAAAKEQAALRAERKRRHGERAEREEMRYGGFRRGSTASGGSGRFGTSSASGSARRSADITTSDGWTTKQGRRSLASTMSTVTTAVGAGERAPSPGARAVAISPEPPARDETQAKYGFSVLDGDMEAEEESETSEDISFKSEDTDVPLISEEEARKKLVSMVNEFFRIRDFAEVAATVQEVDAPSMMYLAVFEGLMVAVDGKPVQRERLAELVQHMVKESFLSHDQLYKGLNEFSEQIDDLVIDIPQVRTYFAELIASLILSGTMPMSYLTQVAGVSGVVIKTLELLLRAKGDDKAFQQMVSDSDVELQPLLESTVSGERVATPDVQSLLERHGLNALIPCL
ncbi:MI domain-containing protein [Plasmodiophora brassicae]